MCRSAHIIVGVGEGGGEVGRRRRKQFGQDVVSHGEDILEAEQRAVAHLPY